MMLLYNLTAGSDWKFLKSYILGILLVLVVFYLVMLFLKTYKKGMLFKRGGHLKIIEALPLSKDNILYIVKVNGEYLLISSSAKNINILKSLEQNEFEDLEGSNEIENISFKGNFKDNLKKILGRNYDRGDK